MKFKKVYIELSDICGLSCSFCPITKNKRGIMSVENFKKTLKEFENRADIIALHILGDPLILSNLKSYLEVAKEQNSNIEITTSGVFLDASRADLLLSYQNIKQINISLASFFHQKKVAFKQYLSNIFYLCDQFSGDGFINLRLWNLDSELKPLNDNSKFYEALGLHFGLNIDKKAQKTRLKRHILLTQGKTFEWPTIKGDGEASGRCYALEGQIGVLSSGVVVPCCMDGGGVIELGNIFQNSLDEIYHSKRATLIREGFKKNLSVEPLCKNCTFKFARVKQI